MSLGTLLFLKLQFPWINIPRSRNEDDEMKVSAQLKALYSFNNQSSELPGSPEAKAWYPMQEAQVQSVGKLDPTRYSFWDSMLQLKILHAGRSRKIYETMKA